MKSLSEPTSDYVLEPGFSTLHKESVAWLQEIELWTDEIRFLFHILKRRPLTHVPPSMDQAIAEQGLVRLNSERLAKLREGVHSHEKHLAACCILSSTADERVYRETHEVLRCEIGEFGDDFRLYKATQFKRWHAESIPEVPTAPAIDLATEADL